MRLVNAFRRTIAVESQTDQRARPERRHVPPDAGARWGGPAVFEIGALPEEPPPASITYSWLNEVVWFRGVESHREYAESLAGSELIPTEAIRSVTFYLGEREVRHERRATAGGITGVTPVIETIREYLRFDFPFEPLGSRGTPHPPPTFPREEPDHD